MVVFDMDKTLLRERFIEVCADKFNFKQALSLLQNIDTDPVSLTNRIAQFLRGRTKAELLDIASGIELIPDTFGVVLELKKRGYIIGIISDSYHLVTQYIAKKINADFSLANELVFNGTEASGHVNIPDYFYHSLDSSCNHLVCKTNALRYIAKVYSMKPAQCLVVGDNDNDACIIKHAMLGISFCSTSELLKGSAHRHIETQSFQELLNYAV